MKYLKQFESYWGDRFFWKAPVKYLYIALTKIKTPPLRLANDKIDTIPVSEYAELIEQSSSWEDDDDEILITYDHGDWSWSACWNDDRLKAENYEYQGDVKLESWEKEANKYNL